MRRRCSFQTPLGVMTALAKEDALCGLRFDGQKHEPEDSGEWPDDPGFPLFVTLREQLASYFNGQPVLFDLPLAPAGSPFQIAIWKLLCSIPYGATTTYGALAGQVADLVEGRASSARAVGSAVGRNPLSIIIPCHRVIGADGSMTGYAGGVERKIALLALEKAP